MSEFTTDNLSWYDRDDTSGDKEHLGDPLLTGMDGAHDKGSSADGTVVSAYHVELDVNRDGGSARSWFVR